MPGEVSTSRRLEVGLTTGVTSEIVTGVVIALDVFLLSRYDAVTGIQHHNARLCMTVEEHLHRAKGKAAV